jgi:predicted amidophosphoribosyltransferase
MECPSCGAWIDDTTQAFCGQCGAPIDDTVSNAAPD